MKINVDIRLVRGILLGSCLGGVCGYLLGRNIARNRHAAELEEVREHFRAKAEDIQRKSRLEHFDVIPVHPGRTVAKGGDGLGTVDVVSLQFKPSVFGGEAGNLDSEPGPGVAGSDAETEHARDDAADALYERTPADDGIDPLAGLEDGDYEPGAVSSLGVDGSGNPIEDDLRDEADRSEDDSDDEDGSSGPVRGEPYLISDQEFFNHREHYQKLTVMYYRASDTLADSQELPIRDIRGTIGLGTTDKFGSNPDEPNILYVRNERIETDFEVCLDYGSYTSSVLGYGTASPKPPRIVSPEE